MIDFELLITSGVGPAEARRFVFQLASRLEALAVARGIEVHEVVFHGDGDAPRSICMHLRGDPELIAAECGTHALVQRSARRGRASRKRWHAAVSLGPAIAPAAAPEIARDELVITACRGSGPGGQHVNKVSSAVRVQHVPSGLCVRSASGRSQKANLDQALRRLAALLDERAESTRSAARSAQRHSHYRLERGRPIRTYRLDLDGDLIERTPS